MPEIREKVVVTGDTSQAVAANKRLDTSFAKTFVAANLGAMALTKAMGFVSGAIGDAFKNAEANLKSTEKLSAALRQQGVVVKTNLTVLNQQSGALQNITGVSDDVIRSMQATGLAMGATTANVDEMVRASFALANATDMDVKTAMRGLSQAISGNAQSLARYLPAVRGLTKEQLKAGDAAKLINAEMGQFLDINTRGLPGQVLQLSNAWDDLGEAFLLAAQSGKTIPAMLDGMTKSLRQLAEVQSATDAGVLELFFGKAAAFFGSDAFAEAQRNAKAIAFWNAEAAKAAAAADERARGFQPKAQIIDVPSPAKLARQARRGGGSAASAAQGSADVSQDDSLLGAISLSSPDIVANRQAVIFRLEQDFQEKLRILRDDHAVAAGEIDRKRAEESERMLREKMAIEGAIVQQGVNAFSGFVVGAAQALAEGADFSDFTKKFLKSIGTQTAAQGVQNLLQAAAIAVIPGLQGNAVALATAGGAQITAGLAMIGGSVAIPGGSSIGGSSGSGGSTPTTRSSTGAGAGVGQGRDEGPRQITIVFNGPTTKPEVGIAIREALAEANALGV